MKIEKIASVVGLQRAVESQLRDATEMAGAMNLAKVVRLCDKMLEALKNGDEKEMKSYYEEICMELADYFNVYGALWDEGENAFSFVTIRTSSQLE